MLRVIRLCTVLITVGSLVLLPALQPSSVQAQATPPTSFAEEFNSATLDSAWQVVQYPRGYNTWYGLPGHYSLSDNAGYLRYYVDPAIHHEGFLNGYLPTNDYTAPGQIMDAGLELHRTFSGDHWVIETKAAYYMPFSNGRNLTFRVYFGDGDAGTLYVGFYRWRDGPWDGNVETNPVCVSVAKSTGPSASNVVQYQSACFPPNPNDTYYYRVERAGGTLTAMWSTDGVTWNTAFIQEMGAELDGLSQRVVLAGLSWYEPAGSYADYDYVRLSPSDELPPTVSSLTGTYVGTVVIGDPVGLDTLDLAVVLTDTNGSLTGHIDSGRLLAYPVTRSQPSAQGPALSGVRSGDSFTLQSAGFTDPGTGLNREIAMHTGVISNTGELITGVYNETLSGLTPQPLHLVGTFSLNRPANTPPAGVPVELHVRSAPIHIEPQGGAIITAQLVDFHSQPVSAVVIQFTASSGSLSSSTAATNALGEASVTLTSGADVGPITVTATGGTLSGVTTLYSYYKTPLPVTPHVGIAAGASGVVLSWSGVTVNANGEPISITSYRVWRAPAPYLAPGDPRLVMLAEFPAPGPGGSEVTYTDLGALDPESPGSFYRVTAVSSTGVESKASAEIATFHFQVVPGAASR